MVVASRKAYLRGIVENVRVKASRKIAMRDLPSLSFILIAVLAYGLAHAADPAPRTFRVWVFADAHVDTDKRNGRESLATALRQSESPAGFDWDIALELGDMSGAQG